MKDPREALGNVLCACGHELRRHDPEDAHCDAPGQYGRCHCRCARSPDPDRTLDEMRLAALAEGGWTICKPDDSEKANLLAFFGEPRPWVPVYRGAVQP
jgi:hypothetical protein